jgi:hypothetical protein
MVTVDSGVVFDFPESWDRFTEGSRCVFHTPLQEEIIASATTISGHAPESDRAKALEHLFANALEAARRGSSAPGLKVTKPIAEEPDLCEFRCATVSANATAGNAFFGQAVIQHPRGVVFLTYEAPFVHGAEQTFRDLLKRIHAHSPQPER